MIQSALRAAAFKNFISGGKLGSSADLAHKHEHSHENQRLHQIHLERVNNLVSPNEAEPNFSAFAQASWTSRLLIH